MKLGAILKKEDEYLNSQIREKLKKLLKKKIELEKEVKMIEEEIKNRNISVTVPISYGMVLEIKYDILDDVIKVNISYSGKHTGHIDSVSYFEIRGDDIDWFAKSFTEFIQMVQKIRKN